MTDYVKLQQPHRGFDWALKQKNTEASVCMNKHKGDTFHTFIKQRGDMGLGVLGSPASLCPHRGRALRVVTLTLVWSGLDLSKSQEEPLKDRI